jgi:hypothetical protein
MSNISWPVIFEVEGREVGSVIIEEGGRGVELMAGCWQDSTLILQLLLMILWAMAGVIIFCLVLGGKGCIAVHCCDIIGKEGPFSSVAWFMRVLGLLRMQSIFAMSIVPYTILE